MGWGQGPPAPPAPLFALQVLPLPGITSVGDPKSRLDHSEPHKASGQLSPPGLFFWEGTGRAIPGLRYRDRRGRRAGGPVGAGRPRPRQRVHAAETGREAPPPPSLIFSNDRSRSLGQVAKAAEPPHAPRHAACKTSEQEGWKPYRIIQGKASAPAPAQPRRREGQERGAAVAPREMGQSGGGFGKENGD